MPIWNKYLNNSSKATRQEEDMDNMDKMGKTKGKGAQFFGKLVTMIVAILVVTVLIFAGIGVRTVTGDSGSAVQLGDIAQIMILEDKDIKLFNVESISASSDIETGEVFLSVTVSLLTPEQ